MSTRRYLDASLKLPAQDLQLIDACRVEQILVDRSAYIVDERNHTTAYSDTRDGDEMHVSFFIAQPPRVSYFCVSCTNENPTSFSSEPQMVATDTEGNLALFLLTYGPHRIKHDYYIYRAPDAAHAPSYSGCRRAQAAEQQREPPRRAAEQQWKRPRGRQAPAAAGAAAPGHCWGHSAVVGLLASSGFIRQIIQFPVRPVLERIVIPEPFLFYHTAPYYFHNNEVGLLRYRTSPPDNTPTLRRQGFDAYKIATLRTHDTERQGSRYNLYTYDSQDKTWDRKTAILKGKKYSLLLASHRSQIVITIGGDVGTMGWVDLEHGIALCDVLGGQEDSSTMKQIRYIPLPDKGPVKTHSILRGTTQRYRTVAVVHDHIEYVEVQIHVRPGARPSRLHGTYFSDGWTVLRWSRTVTSTSRWTMDCKLTASDITVPADMAALLPMLPTEEDSAATTLERLHVGHPTISLGDDSDVVYFMAKIDEMEEAAWVIAVNTKKKLQGVTEFRPRSRHSLEFTYIPTTISKHLTPPGAKGNVKRPGMVLPGSANKKLLPAVPLMYESFCGQNLQNAQVEQGDDTTDPMDIE
ncbi:hypothetical protein D1007_29166 [Hordeum vulgare]|nr:hypothetical protein D1007_29166 [Hordeum vulgare]